MKHGAGGEDALHAIFRSAFVRRKDLPVGPGDDCAVLRPRAGGALVLSVDQLVGGVHLDAGAAPALWARKLVGRSLSDLAAAGARPWALAWTAAVPACRGLAWMKRLARAMLREADRHGVAVIGGDLANAPRPVLTCTVLGRAGRRLPPGRGGARPGDRLAVTGRLGDAVRSGRHLRPVPRIEEGRLLNDRFHARAMLDLSDGLRRDLPRLLAASACGARIELRCLPLAAGLAAGCRGWQAALCDGEDYELLVALSPDDLRRALRNPRLRATGLTAVGVCVERRRGLRWLDDGRPLALKGRGWEHAWR